MKYKTSTLVLLLAPLVFSFAIGQDIFIPEVPQLVKIFNAPIGLVQLTLSLFILSVGAGQLLAGPLSDAHGRRKTVLFSILLYVLGSLGAALSQSILFLIFCRVVQGLGACGMMVCTFAIVRDIFAGKEGAKIYSYLNGAIAISPLLAPLAGGYLYTWFGWRAPFFALLIIGLIIFTVIFFFLTETLDPRYQKPFNLNIFSRYYSILKNPTFLVFTFAAASALSCFFIFFSVSPYILITILKVPETHFGYYFAFIGIIFFCGSVIAGKLNSKIGLLQVSLIGSILFIVSGLVMLFWTISLGTSILSFMLPSSIAAIGGAFMMGAGAGGALEPFTANAGAAAALLGSSEFLLATAAGTIALQWGVKSNLPYAIPLTLFGLSCSTLILIYYYTTSHANALHNH